MTTIESLWAWLLANPIWLSAPVVIWATWRASIFYRTGSFIRPKPLTAREILLKSQQATDPDSREIYRLGYEIVSRTDAELAERQQRRREAELDRGQRLAQRKWPGPIEVLIALGGSALAIYVVRLIDGDQVQTADFIEIVVSSCLATPGIFWLRRRDARRYLAATAGKGSK